MQSSAASLARQPIGLSLRPPHLRDLQAMRPALGFVEVRACDIGSLGGVAPPELQGLAHHWPLVMQASEMEHRGELARLEAQGQELDRLGNLNLRRLSLPIKPDLDASVLAPVIEVIQARLGQPVLMELGSSTDALGDTLKLADLARQTRSRLTLEPDRLLAHAFNKVQSNARSEGQSPKQMWQQAMALALDTIWSLPPTLVSQIRSGGLRASQARQSPPYPWLFERGQRISPVGWTLLRQTWEHLGPVPTVLAWDADLPGLAVVLDEVRLASELMIEIGADKDDELDMDD